MKKIAIFYHVCINLHPDHGINIVTDQINALNKSGLLSACSDFYVGLNGDDADQSRISKILTSKAIIFQNSKDTWQSGEVQTLREMREFAIANPDYYVCYFHVKGLSYPPESPNYNNALKWRLRMESVVINRWKECVNYLDRGFDSVGQWWHVAFNGSYWAGNFFWATAKFISTLPNINTEGQVSGGRYEAEVWIGKGQKQPKIKIL